MIGNLTLILSYLINVMIILLINYQDEMIPDREEDIRPRFHRSRSHHANQDQDDEDEDGMDDDSSLSGKSYTGCPTKHDSSKTN